MEGLRPPAPQSDTSQWRTDPEEMAGPRTSHGSSAADRGAHTAFADFLLVCLPPREEAPLFLVLPPPAPASHRAGETRVASVHPRDPQAATVTQE